MLSNHGAPRDFDKWRHVSKSRIYKYFERASQTRSTFKQLFISMCFKRQVSIPLYTAARLSTNINVQSGRIRGCQTDRSIVPYSTDNRDIIATYDYDRHHRKTLRPQPSYRTAIYALSSSGASMWKNHSCRAVVFCGGWCLPIAAGRTRSTKSDWKVNHVRRRATAATDGINASSRQPTAGRQHQDHRFEVDVLLSSWSVTSDTRETEERSRTKLLKTKPVIFSFTYLILVSVFIPFVLVAFDHCRIKILLTYVLNNFSFYSTSDNFSFSVILFFEYNFNFYLVVVRILYNFNYSSKVVRVTTEWCNHQFYDRIAKHKPAFWFASRYLIFSTFTGLANGSCKHLSIFTKRFQRFLNPVDGAKYKFFFIFENFAFFSKWIGKDSQIPRIWVHWLRSLYLWSIKAVSLYLGVYKSGVAVLGGL